MSNTRENNLITTYWNSQIRVHHFLYLKPKSLQRSLKTKYFEFMSFLKLSKSRTSSMSFFFDMFSNWFFVRTIIITTINNKYCKYCLNFLKNGDGFKMMLTFQQSYVSAVIWSACLVRSKFNSETANFLFCAPWRISLHPVESPCYSKNNKTESAG